MKVMVRSFLCAFVLAWWLPVVEAAPAGTGFNAVSSTSSRTRAVLHQQPPPGGAVKPADPLYDLTNQVTHSVRDSIRAMLTSSARFLPALVAALIVIVIFWGLASFVSYLVQAATRYMKDATVKLLLMQVSYYMVWGIGLIVALNALGMDPQAVITGLGLTGVALGFALKDILSNFISGILILSMGSVEIGDQIVVGDTEGTVELIELRATHIRTYEGTLVLVPNGEVFTSRVTNNTASPLRRASVFFFVDYQRDISPLLAVVLDAVRTAPGVAAQPPASTRLADLTPTHMQGEARFWTASNRTDFMNTSSAVRLAVVNALKGAREQPAATAPQPQAPQQGA